MPRFPIAARLLRGPRVLLRNTGGRLGWTLVAAMGVCALVGSAAAEAGAIAAERDGLAELASRFEKRIQPLLKDYCLECHSTEKQKGDLDLERFQSLADIVRHPQSWVQMVDQVALGEMPPKEASPLPAAERKVLLDWVHEALEQAALARAGDPGPVVLRRLNNAEYAFTLRDLTGVATLDPAREFPGDSAAGEGFMNTGQSLVMSPALLSKYLEAAKAIASHAVLLPEGFRFSEKNTRRDWTAEIVAQIQAIYRQYADAPGQGKANGEGLIIDAAEGGRIPLQNYFVAAFEMRSAGLNADLAASTAAKHRLSPKYLETFWKLLDGGDSSLLLDDLHTHWREAKPDDAAELAAGIARWQKALWKFSSIGHIGKADGPKAWMEPVDPLVEKLELRLKLAAPTNSHELTFHLAVSDAGDGSQPDALILDRPRFVLPGGQEILLREARALVGEMSARRERFLPQTLACLAAAAEAAELAEPPEIGALAAKHGVELDALEAWFGYLGIGSSANTKAAPAELAYLTNKLEKVAGHEAARGWGSTDTPNLVANSSSMELRIPGRLKGHGVVLHPSPQQAVAVGWRSPITGTVRVQAAITPAHPECGNGVTWWLELRRGPTRLRLAAGTAQGAKESKVGPFEQVALRSGDLLAIVIGPRNGDHSCDLTGVDWSITEVAGQRREWDLARDIAADPLAGNPHADGMGHDAIWHIYSEPAGGQYLGPVIPAGSLLADWQLSPDAEEKRCMAHALQALVSTGGWSGTDKEPNHPNNQLRRQIVSLGGPLFAGAPGARKPDLVSEGGSAVENTAWGLDPTAFGRPPTGRSPAEWPAGSPIDPASLGLHAPAQLAIRLPADLVADAEFVAEAKLLPSESEQASVQVQLRTDSAPDSGDPGVMTRTVPGVPILVREGGAARQRFEQAFGQFREFFPAALCFPRIIPTDEVITLTLFFREDEPLARLMLDGAQSAELNRLWDQLRFVSQDALVLVDAFEQLWQFATQGGDPSRFEPLRAKIEAAAAAFRQRQAESESPQLEALIQWAKLAYRRPLRSDEAGELHRLYSSLRGQELSHDEAFRLTLARILVAPAFLYRTENAPAGREAAPVGDWELASRLSYFLWSSAPDAALHAVAAAGNLGDPAELARQARRMLRDGRVRRLATEFACAWLQIHDFAELEDKSERHFPTFGPLRGDMYEEAILFFTHLFQDDASILEILGADHTYLNETLAAHYHIPDVQGAQWRRVEGVRQFGRGGILGLAATLAKQSGASRTSPILRGNWLAETLLGERLPRPPKDVPLLPEDEAASTLTVRQLVEKHASDPRCYGCHARIDPYGFALEEFDAIGRARTRDLGGRPIDVRTALMDGTQLEGLTGLREYLLGQKRPALVRQFCRKLLGYALGRTVLLSDHPLLGEMESNLRKNDYRFAAAVETIVLSKQFRQIRGREMEEMD